MRGSSSAAAPVGRTPLPGHPQNHPGNVHANLPRWIGLGCQEHLGQITLIRARVKIKTWVKNRGLSFTKSPILPTDSLSVLLSRYLTLGSPQEACAHTRAPPKSNLFGIRKCICDGLKIWRPARVGSAVNFPWAFYRPGATVLFNFRSTG